MNTPSLPFDLASLVLCCHGSIYAIGGPVDAVERIANTINNYDRSPARELDTDPRDGRKVYGTLNRRCVEVYKTHKTFAYVTASEESFAEAFEHLRRLSVPRTGSRANLRKALKLARGLARTDFHKIKRENFLGWQAGVNSFIDIAVGGSSVDDSSGEWRSATFATGLNRASGETLKASAA